MKKRILLLIVVATLVVALCGCLIACDKSDTKGSSFSIGTGEEETVGSTTRITATSKVSFEIYSAESSTTAEISSKVVVKNKSGVKQDIAVVRTDVNGQNFKVVAPTGGYATGWYTIEVDSSISFVNYNDVSKISFYVPSANAITSDYTEDVVLVLSTYFSNFSKDSKGVNYFDFDTAHSGKTLSVGQIAMIEDADSGDQTAYKVTSVKEYDGYIRCSYVAPEADDVYEALVVTDTASLNSSVSEDNYTSLVENSEDVAAFEELAMASFGIGKADFDINCELKDTNVTLTIVMTIPDLVETESGSFLDLALTFTIESTIDVNTEISLGSLMAIEDKGTDIVADITSVMTFRVDIEDTETVSDSAALDDILNAIQDMIKGVNENDVEINIFNWIIPIGNGVANIEYQASVVMNFTFGGEIGVESSSIMEFTADLVYNPELSSPVSVNLSEPTFEFVSVSADIAADLHTRIGLNNELTFNLLGGVLSLGIGAEVGNYNDFYGAIATGNLLEGLDVTYGYYVEGGVYYDVYVIYNIAGLIKGHASVVDGTQYIDLYHTGSKYMVNSLVSSNIIIGASAIDLEVYGYQTNITNGEKNSKALGDAAVLIDATKITIAQDVYNYVKIENGMISLTEAGINAKVNGYSFKITADGCDAVECTISLVDSEEATAGNAIVSTIGSGKTNVTAAYVGGESVDVSYTGEAVTIAAEDSVVGTLVIYVDNVAVKVIYVK